jgi:putative ABC transport system permease protein
MLVAVGIGLGILGSLATSRLLERMLFQIEPGDPLTLILVSVLFAAVAVAACLPPVRRAVRLDPISVLQAE